MARSIADPTFYLREETATNLAFYVYRGLGIALLALWLSGVVAGRFGVPESDELWTNPHVMIGFGVLLAALAYLALVIRRRVMLNREFKFPPGQYLFPYTLIDARQTRLQVVDLRHLKGIDAIERRTNGAYSHTTFTFTFADAPDRVWKIHNKKRADNFGLSLGALQSAAHDALQRNDLATLLQLDPFFEIRKQNWSVPLGAPLAPKSRLHAVLARPLVAALALALLLAPTLWVARNVGADFAMQAQAKRLATEKAYNWYIATGWFGVREMRAALPRVALAEVRKRNSVTALRALLTRFPEAGLQADVAADIHLLYQRALTRFKEQAITSDPSMLASMEKLLQILEQRGDPKVAIHFTRPSTEELVTLDAKIVRNEAKLDGKKIIPASQHFQADSAAPREARIAAGLVAAFRTIFANDVLDLRVDAKGTLPMLDITYQIAPSGAIFVSDENKEKAFVGLVARFQAALQAEQDDAPWRFQMEVLPPDRFQVNYQSSNGRLAGGPSEGQVYAVMAERAFDELDMKIRAAFFRTDSAAFKRRAEPMKPALRSRPLTSPV